MDQFNCKIISALRYCQLSNSFGPSKEQLSTFDLYRFTAEHYRKRWTLLLLINHLVYDKRFPILAYLRSQFYRQKKISLDLSTLQSKLVKKQVDSISYDVIIPTIGRPQYLYDVLKDLNSQMIAPVKVIVIEQNADPKSKSELDFLNAEIWNFQLIHEFTHITGACRARNQAVFLSTAPWILFFDDDVRVGSEFMNRSATFIKKTGAKSVTFSCLQKGEVEVQKFYKQWETFGSGCSLVHRSIVEQCSFDLALEHGYGEDADYGMQIRNLGYDILYCPDNNMLHLKAPIGGFRHKFTFPWDYEEISPKPSPQVMYNRRKNSTVQQLKGYKLFYF